MGKKIIKHFLPLIIVFVLAVIFFAGYNRYLLDTSLANLKISLKELKNTKDFAEVKRISSVLENTFLAELTKGDFDLTFALKLEMANQMLTESTKEAQAKNEDYVMRLSSATGIEFAATVAQNISKETQIKDIEYFLEESIAKKTAKKNRFIAKMEDIVVALFPGQRKENSGKIKDTIETLEKNLSSYQGEKLQEKYLEVVKLYLLVKDWQRAESYLNKSIEINSNNPSGLKAQFFLGILYRLKGEFKEAGTVFKKIKDKLPREWKDFSAYEEADCLYKTGEKEEAVKLFEKNYQESPSSEIGQMAQFRAGYTYLYDLNNSQKAQEIFAKLPKAAPQAALASYVSHKINPDIANEYCNEGFKLIKEGYETSTIEKYQESLKKFDSALKIVANHSLSRMGKGLVYYLLGLRDEALAEALEAKKIDPQRAEVVSNLGFIYYNLGILDKAIGEFENAVNLKPNSSLFHYNLGVLYLIKEDYSKSERHFKKAISINPKYAYAHNNLGYVFWAKGDYNAAKERFKKAVALKPGYIDAHYNLAVVEYTLGRYEEAKKEFLRVQELKPAFKESGRYLKQIKQKIGY